MEKGERAKDGYLLLHEEDGDVRRNGHLTHSDVAEERRFTHTYDIEVISEQWQPSVPMRTVPTNEAIPSPVRKGKARTRPGMCY
jgi:hypothetical protein